jgi:hypothetical protein
LSFLMPIRHIVLFSHPYCPLTLFWMISSIKMYCCSFRDRSNLLVSSPGRRCLRMLSTILGLLPPHMHPM